MVKNMESFSTSAHEVLPLDTLEEWERNLLEGSLYEHFEEASDPSADPLAEQLNNLPSTPFDKEKRIQTYERGDHRQDHATRGTTDTIHGISGKILSSMSPEELRIERDNQRFNQGKIPAKIKEQWQEIDVSDQFLAALDDSETVPLWDEDRGYHSITDTAPFTTDSSDLADLPEIEIDPFDQVDYPELRDEIQNAFKSGKKVNAIKVQLDPELDEEIAYSQPDYVNGYGTGEIGDSHW